MPKRLSNGEKGTLKKFQILVNWAIFEALYIFCFSLAQQGALTQHTLGYVKRMRRLKIELRVERF